MQAPSPVPANEALRHRISKNPSVAWWRARLNHGQRCRRVPVAMLYNDNPFSVMMASPTDLEDFALGFSMTEGTISDPSQLLRIEVRPSLEGIELAMEVTDSAPIVSMPKDATRNLPGRSGCGLCGN